MRSFHNRLMAIFDNLWRLRSHSFNFLTSHYFIPLTSCRPICCRISVGINVTGATYPKGLYNELATERIPRPAMGCSFKCTSNTYLSSLWFHWTPQVSTRCICLSNDMLSGGLAFFPSGMLSITSLLFESYFVSLNPPLDKILHSYAASLIPSLASLTDLRRSSTYKFRCTLCTAVSEKSSALSSAVRLNAKLHNLVMK